jgi:hypothetical protein
MKRCPKCEFLYEEDQRHCDMDGTALLHDFTFLLESGVRTNGSRSIWKVLMQIGLPLVVLSLLSFYVFKHQIGTQNSTPASRIVVSDSETSADAARKPQSASPLGAEGSSMNTNAGPSAPGGVDSSNTNPSKDSEGVNATATESQESLPLETANVNTTSSDLTGTTNRLRGSSSAPNRSSLSPNRRSLRPQPQKKESKVTSFLKKTGRFLTKPFKN